VLDAAGDGDATDILDTTSPKGWDLRWSYDCSNSGGHGVFIADVFKSDRTPDFASPGVDEEGGARGSGVYHVSGAGRFYLEISATCRWAVEAVESP
jgi:hypothetical protein